MFFSFTHDTSGKVRFRLNQEMIDKQTNNKNPTQEARKEADWLKKQAKFNNTDQEGLTFERRVLYTSTD